MLEYLFEPYNEPFSLAFAAMLVVLSLELISLLAGLGLSQILDNLFDGADIGLDTETDAEFENSLISKYIAWVKIKNVPMLILIVVFLAFFSINGFVLQNLMEEFFDAPLENMFSIPIAFFTAIPLYKWAAGVLGKKVFKDQTSAISERSFIGRYAEINVGKAKLGLPAEAKFKDEFGQLHYVMVEPIDGDEIFEEGTLVELIQKEDANFKAKRVNQIRE